MTKYLGGHSDLIGGAARDERRGADRAPVVPRRTRRAPSRALWTATSRLRGVKTLALRMEAHCRGAKRIAEFLQGHPRVARGCITPGLPGHPGFEVAVRQMKDFGGMVSFEVGSRDEAGDPRSAESTRLFFLAESLGGVESLIEVPGPMTHASVCGLAARGARDAENRALGQGIEHPDDLVADLEQRAGLRLRSPSRSSAVEIAKPARRTPGGPVVDHADRELLAAEPVHGGARRRRRPRPTRCRRARTPCPARARPGCSSSGMSQVRKNGIQGSRLGSSSPAIRQRTASPSGRCLDPATTSNPRRDATASRWSVTTAIVDHPRRPGVAPARPCRSRTRPRSTDPPRPRAPGTGRPSGTIRSPCPSARAVRP